MDTKHAVATYVNGELCIIIKKYTPTKSFIVCFNRLWKVHL